MQVYKFGGASVKDADGVRNLSHIVSINRGQDLLIVVSAMGKTTNALELLTKAYFNGSANLNTLFHEVRDFHYEIIKNLFPTENDPIYDDVGNTLIEIEWMLEDEPHPDYNFNYDQIVSIGELLSSRIVNAYLNSQSINSKWLDARSFIQTDNTYREGEVNWEKTCLSIQSTIPKLISGKVLVTQGFIGGTSENYTTTLGREGSDYSAAIFASCLNVESLTIWKDVPGVLNADPKLFTDTIKYTELPYSEALEMSFYGASIIHPKTIKPLKNLNIALFVKPFLHPLESGTVINQSAKIIKDQPAVILKLNQVLISFSKKDFSFISENHLSDIFKVFSSGNVKINMMQNSALSFSVCFDWDEEKFNYLKNFLSAEFKIKYNQDLQLLTVRHPNKKILASLSSGKTILLEQISRNTAQLVIKKVE
ncbi:MAG: aspartate kinase [Flavobacterium sp.]|nr:aspartate kinase [Pedobacter sp.]